MTDPDLLAGVVWSLICFLLGVAYAIYRAVGWTERMRAWAESVPLDLEKESQR